MPDARIAEDDLPFDGERFIPGQGGSEIALEHTHRYLFARSLTVGSRVLDVGCGVGYGATLLAGYSGYMGIDVAAAAIGVANAHFANDGAAFQVGDASSLLFPDSSFDAVVSFELLEHVPEPGDVVAEIARVLTPGGVFVSSTPDTVEYNKHRSEPNRFHPSEMTHEEYVSLLSRHFPNVEIFAQKHSVGSVLFRPGVLHQPGEILFPPKWVSDPPTAEYLVAVASRADLPVTSASGMFVAEDERIGEMQAALHAASEREAKAQQQLAEYEETSTRMQAALHAASERESGAQQQLAEYEETIRRTQAALHAASEREGKAQQQLAACEETIRRGTAE